MQQSPQEWIESGFSQSFAALAERGFRLERLQEQEYWALFAAKMQSEFLPEAFFNLDKLRDGGHWEQRKHWQDAYPPHRLAIFCALYQEDRLAAMFCGEMRDSDTWRMWNTVVHSDFRRQGIYRQIAQGWIDFSRALGFDRITSEHAICNNPIIIAKLKLGFQIWSIEMNHGYGPTLVLSYFHHPAQQKAYEVRCGLARLEPMHLEAANPAMLLLARQFGGKSPQES